MISETGFFFPSNLDESQNSLKTLPNFEIFTLEPAPGLDVTKNFVSIYLDESVSALHSQIC